MSPLSITTIASRNLNGRTKLQRAVQAMLGQHRPLTPSTTTTPVCHRQFSHLLHQQNSTTDNNTAIGIITRNARHPYTATPYRTMSSTEDKTTSSQTPPSDSDDDTSEPPSDSDPEPTEETEVQKLQAQVTELNDKLLRSLAEQENIRRIARRDVDNSKSYAVTSFAKSLLDTSDNLSRALEAVPEEHRGGSGGGGDNPVLANLYEGIEMTDAGLTKALVKNGLVKFGAVGDVFDPNRHEALFEYVEEGKAAGTVGQVMKVGFELNKRVIRPAEVGVVKKS